MWGCKSPFWSERRAVFEESMLWLVPLVTALQSPLLSSAQDLSSHQKSSTEAGMPWVRMCDPVASPQQTQANYTCLRASWRVRKSTPKAGSDIGHNWNPCWCLMPGTGLGITAGKTAFSAGRSSSITPKEKKTRSTESPAVQFGHFDGVSQSLPAVPLPALVESTRVFQKCLPAPFIAYTAHGFLV